MESILAPDCVEFGRSGRTYTRGDILQITSGDIRATLPLPEFTVRLLARDVALVNTGAKSNTTSYSEPTEHRSGVVPAADGC